MIVALQTPARSKSGGTAGLLLLLTLGLGFPSVLFAQVQAQAPAQTQAQPSPTQDIGWPRQIGENGATLVYYQPQVDEWKDYRELSGRMAFSLTPAGGSETMGVCSFQTGTLVDESTRTVYLRDLKITSVRFPSLDSKSVPAMEALFRKLAPTGSDPISLDRLMADMEKSSVKAHPVPVKNDPPEIFYSGNPAILLLVQGDPVLAPIEKIKLQFVVNTNWDLFYDKSEKTYYLLVNNAWLASQNLKGPWGPTTMLPKDMAKLPAGQNFDDVKKFVPPPPPSGAVPHVFFASVPAELILTKGSPVYAKIPGTRLLYVTNTDNDLFVDDSSKEYYVLLSGRWFRSGALGGPWSYAGNNLPEDFAKIPPNSPKSAVLASVPGTIEAADAVMLAQIPTTAIVNRAQAEAKAKVTYDGEPQFKPIEGTSLQYATNTEDKVIKVGDLYYLCFQAVWFVSASPNGPWKTADSVPKEIYSIPPSSPVYNVTYVTQTNPTPTTVESCSTGGYMGMFVIGMAAGMAIGYGTGYYYPPYVYWGGGYGYPVYRPWPATYGVGAVYYPRTGVWGAGRAAYGPYGSVGSSAWYNPSTGRYGRSATVQSPYGGRTVANSYNPWTGRYGATSQGHNAYGQWGSSVASNGNQWARSGHVTTSRGTVAGYQTSSGQQGYVRSGANGTVARNSNGTYAGSDGNVYRKNSNGSWSQYNNGSWNQVDTTQAKQQAQQNVQNRQQTQQNVQNRQQQSTQTLQNSSRTGSSQSSLGSGSAQRSSPAVSQSTMQGLDNSAAARQSGQMRTQQYQGGGGGARSRGGGGRRR